MASSRPRSNPSFLAMPASDTPTIASRAACRKQDDAGPTPPASADRAAKTYSLRQPEGQIRHRTPNRPPREPRRPLAGPIRPPRKRRSPSRWTGFSGECWWLGLTRKMAASTLENSDSPIRGGRVTARVTPPRRASRPAARVCLGCARRIQRSFGPGKAVHHYVKLWRCGDEHGAHLRVVTCQGGEPPLGRQQAKRAWPG